MSIREELKQTVGLVSFFSSLVAGSIVIWLVWKVGAPAQQEIGDNAQLEAVRRSHQWTETLLNSLPVVFLLIGVSGTIAFVVYQTRFA